MPAYRRFIHLVSSCCRAARSDAGQVVLISALLAPALVGMTGLAIDVGFAAAGRRDAQNAADAAALAGAGVLHDGGTIAAARTTATTVLQQNGFKTSEATVNIPPASGPHKGDSAYVEVALQRARPTVFMRVLRVYSIHTGARAVAKVSRMKNYAMVVLDPTMCSAYNQSSNNRLTLRGGGAMVNSSCQPAGSQGGGSSLSSPFIDYYTPGSWNLSNNASTSVAPEPVPSRFADPLASLTRPAPGTASPDSGGTAQNPQLLNISGSATLHPGTYYGGIKISSSGNVTFLPGLYVLAGGGLTYSGSGVISGNGVSFFNTSDASASKKGSGDCGSITLQGSGQLALSAPASGPTKDMLFWQDDACTQQMKYAGSTYTTAGVIYLPKANLNVSGGGALGALQVIVDSFNYTGSTSVTIDCGNYVQVGPIALVE